MDQKVFDVQGMTCASCSAHVEKAANSVSGVSEARVNLLKNSMEVDYDGNPDTLKQISDAVSKAGYEATPRSDKKDSAATTKADATDASEKAVKQKRIELISSMAFAIPLFYLAMGEMIGAPVPPAVSGMNGMMNLALTELLLCIPCQQNYWDEFWDYFTNPYGDRDVDSDNPFVNIVESITNSIAEAIYGIFG